jgi:hypothetical protein
MMKKKNLVCAFALALVIGPHVPTAAAPRCYPTERFKVIDDQWVRDTLTSLVWQRQTSATTMKWSEALSYCLNIGLRLPTSRELLSIVDLTMSYPDPAIDRKAFPDVSAEGYWTSTPQADSFAGRAWFINFGEGYLQAEGIAANHRVRCVR